MNKVRIIGLVFLAIGIILFFLFEGYLPGIAAGLLTGIGIGLLLTGRVGIKK